MKNATIRAALNMIGSHLDSQLSCLQDRREEWCKLENGPDIKKYWGNDEIIKLAFLVALCNGITTDICGEPPSPWEEGNLNNSMFRKNPKMD